MTSALSTRQIAEQDAWDNYTAGMLSIPDPPPFGERIPAPPSIQIPAIQGIPPELLPMLRIEMTTAPLIVAQVAVEDADPVDHITVRRGVDYNNTVIMVERGGELVPARKWGGEVVIDARLADDVDPASYDFQLFMRGTERLRITRLGVVRDVNLPARRLRGSGMNLHETEWRGDSPRIQFTDWNFSMSDLVGHTILESDEAAMTRWSALIAQNSLDGLTIEFNIVYEFEARIIDRRSGEVVERQGYTWSLGGPIDEPVVTTNLEPFL